MSEKLSYWERVTRGRISRRRALTGAAALGAGAAALSLVGCGGGGDGEAGDGPRVSKDEGTPKPGGVWRQSTITVAPHFSPFHPGADPSYINTFRRDFGYYDSLWHQRETPDPKRQMYLRLAQSIEQVDETTVTVKLNQANFQNVPASKSNAKVNGRQFSAEDVVARIEFLKVPPASANTFIKEDLVSVRAIDNLTVQYKTKGPRAFFYEAGQGVAIRGYEVPREMLDETTLKEDIPIGTGPFMYKSHQLASREELVRNPNYFVKDRPYLDGRLLTIVPDTAAEEAAFRANQTDSTGFSDVKQKDNVARDLGKKIKVTSYPTNSGMALILNIRKEIFKDIRVREAVHRAINVDRVIQIVYFGDAHRGWYFSDASDTRFPIGYEAVKQYVSYDPAKAAQLLKAANVDPNVEYEFMVPPEAQTWVDGGGLLSEDLNKVGLKNRIVPYVRNIYLQRAGPKPADKTKAAEFDITMSVYLDYNFLKSDSGSFWNNASLEDPEVDALVDRITETVDAVKRKELSNELELMLAKKYANFVPVLTGNVHVADYAYMKGIDFESSRSGLGGWQITRWIDK